MTVPKQSQSFFFNINLSRFSTKRKNKEVRNQNAGKIIRRAIQEINYFTDTVKS